METQIARRRKVTKRREFSLEWLRAKFFECFLRRNFITYNYTIRTSFFYKACFKLSEHFVYRMTYLHRSKASLWPRWRGMCVQCDRLDYYTYYHVVSLKNPPFTIEWCGLDLFSKALNLRTHFFVRRFLSFWSFLKKYRVFDCIDEQRRMGDHLVLLKEVAHLWSLL